MSIEYLATRLMVTPQYVKDVMAGKHGQDAGVDMDDIFIVWERDRADAIALRDAVSLAAHKVAWMTQNAAGDTERAHLEDILGGLVAALDAAPRLRPWKPSDLIKPGERGNWFDGTTNHLYPTPPEAE